MRVANGNHRTPAGSNGKLDSRYVEELSEGSPLNLNSQEPGHVPECLPGRTLRTTFCKQDDTGRTSHRSDHWAAKDNRLGNDSMIEFVSY